MAESCSKYTDHKKKIQHRLTSDQTQTANTTENKASLLTAGFGLHWFATGRNLNLWNLNLQIDINLPVLY